MAIVPSRPPPPSGARTRPAILVVDDEQDMREMLAFTLALEDYDVATAASGEEALDATRMRKFDVCVTDLKMPGMGGVATVKALKQVEPRLVVVVVTGYATAETEAICMAAGADDYVRKPYDLSHLVRVIERALSSPAPAS